MALTEKQLAVVTARNALLRAWKAYGVPLAMKLYSYQGMVSPVVVMTSQWVYPPGDGPSVFLRLECEQCGRFVAQSSFPEPEAMTRWERALIARIEDPALDGRPGCEHLARIIERPIPAEVIAIAEMELIAGGG